MNYYVTLGLFLLAIIVATIQICTAVASVIVSVFVNSKARLAIGIVLFCLLSVTLPFAIWIGNKLKFLGR